MSSGAPTVQSTAPPPVPPSGAAMASNYINRVRPAGQHLPPSSPAPATLATAAKATNAPAVRPTPRRSPAVPITTTNAARAANASTARLTLQHAPPASVTTAKYDGNGNKVGVSAPSNRAEDVGSFRNARTTTSSIVPKGNNQSDTPKLARQKKITNDGGAVQPPQNQGRRGIPARPSIDEDISTSENSDSELSGSQAGFGTHGIPIARRSPPQPATPTPRNPNSGSRIQAPSANKPATSRNERPGTSARRLTYSRPQLLNPSRPAAARAQQAEANVSGLNISDLRSRIEGSSSSLLTATPSRGQIRSSEQQGATKISTPQKSNFGHRNDAPSSSLLAAARNTQLAQEPSIPVKTSTQRQLKTSRHPVAAREPGASTVQKPVYRSRNEIATPDMELRPSEAPRVDHEGVNTSLQQELRAQSHAHAERKGTALILRHNQNLLIPVTLSGPADTTSGILPRQSAVAQENNNQSLDNENGTPRTEPVLQRVVQSYNLDTSNCTPLREADAEIANVKGAQPAESRGLGECTERRSQSPPLHQLESLERLPRSPLGRYTPLAPANPRIGDARLGARDQRRQELVPPSHNLSYEPSPTPPASRHEPPERSGYHESPTGPRLGYQGALLTRSEPPRDSHPDDAQSRGSYRGGHHGRGEYREEYGRRRRGSYTPGGRGYRGIRGGRGGGGRGGRRFGRFPNGDHHAPNNYRPVYHDFP